MEKTESDTAPQSQIEPAVSMNRLLQLLQQINTNKPVTETTSNIHLAEKMNNTNYAKWSRLMHLDISGRGRVNHIITPPLATDDPGYTSWVQRGALVFSWIIENIDADLVNQYLDYPTAYELWRGIETRYRSGQDGLQIFDLTVKANTFKQGKETRETFYSRLITIWKEIDVRVPNPMKCPEDITKYNEITQRDKLYQFLVDIDNSLDKERRDLLNQTPLPTAEVAYSTTKREISRRSIMKGGTPSLEESSSGIEAGFLSQNRQKTDKRMIKPTKNVNTVDELGIPRRAVSKLSGIQSGSRTEKGRTQDWDWSHGDA